MTQMRIVWVLAILAVFVSCSDDPSGTSVGGCKDVALSSKLHPIFYWGRPSLTDYVPNTEPQASDVVSPQWVSPDSIMVVSITRHAGVFVKGVFSVHMDAATLDYKGVTEYGYPNGIYSARWDNTSSTVWVLDSPSPQETSIVRCHLSSNGLVTDAEVVDSSWQPRHMCVWAGHAGVVFIGVDPVSSVAGVYWRNTDSDTDSLLYAAADTEVLAGSISFTADGNRLLVGVNQPQNPAQLLSIATTIANDRRVVATRSHYALGAEGNPVDADIAAFVYRFNGDDTNPPEDVVEVIRLSTGDSTKINVRTHTALCRFTRVESVSWNPMGNDLAFASGAQDSEGGNYPYRLWVIRPAK